MYISFLCSTKISVFDCKTRKCFLKCLCIIFCVYYVVYPFHQDKNTSFFSLSWFTSTLISLICSPLWKLCLYKRKKLVKCMRNLIIWFLTYYVTNKCWYFCFCAVACSESSKLVVGRVGETVTLPCKYDINTNGLLSICWGRHQSVFSCENTVISSDGLQVNYRESHRFSLASGLDQGDVSLTIRAAENRDAGMYVCRIEIPGLFNDISYNVYLFISNGE